MSDMPDNGNLGPEEEFYVVTKQCWNTVFAWLTKRPIPYEEIHPLIRLIQGNSAGPIKHKELKTLDLKRTQSVLETKDPLATKDTSNVPDVSGVSPAQ